MQDKSEPNDGGSNPAQNDAISADDLIDSLAAPVQETEEEETTEETEEEESDTEETEADEAEETEEEETETEADSEVDFDSLTPEQLQDAAKKSRSKLLADLGKLRAENRDLKQQAPVVQQAPAKSVTSPYLKDVNTEADLAAKLDELKDARKQTTKLLRRNEGLGADDLIEVETKNGTKNVTKASLLDLEDALVEAIEEAVPSKQAEIRLHGQIQTEVAAVKERLKAEVKELSDEKSTVAEKYSGIIESDLFKGLFRDHPASEPVLRLLVAHGVKGLFGKAKAVVPAATGAKPKVKPPGSPSGVAAGAPKPGASEKAKADAKLKRFEESTSAEDLIAAMAG